MNDKKLQQDPRGLSWAGGYHSGREDFRRTKDELKNWTNVAFRK